MLFYYETLQSQEPHKLRAETPEDAVKRCKALCGHSLVIVYSEEEKGKMVVHYDYEGRT